MSARMLRRLQPADLVAAAPEEEEEEEEEEKSTGAANIFDLLGDEADVEDDNEGSEEVQVPSSSKPQQATNEKRQRKKKKGKKKDQPAVEDESLSKLLEEMAIKPSKKEEPVVIDKRASVVSVDPKHLRAEEELRRIFGSKVINAVERSGEGAGLTGPRRRQGVRNAGRNVSLRKKLLVLPMDAWPRWDGGVSMELTEVKENATYFRYVYSPSYLEIQKRFEECVASHDPNTIAMLLARHPYHLDSLLALAEVYKHVGEHQQSAALLERCLYALECAWHPNFNPVDGKCRLDYSWEPNRPLFKALFRHMQHLGRRGCHRTALEICKLLLSLDLDDPTGARFCVDYYALRAEQYAWLESFIEDFYEDRWMALFPNFSFSLAIARFYLEQKESKSEDSAVIPSQDLLQQALMLHPLVLANIVSRAPIKEDSTWSKLLKHPHFAKATPGSPTLEHLINIYIERSYLIWRTPDLQSWLKTAALAVTEQKSEGERASWACARAQAFEAEYNEYQHLSVSEFSDSAPTLPPDEGQAHHAAAVAAAEEAAAGLENRNPFSVFMESLLPWRNYGEFQIDAEEEEEEEEGEDHQ